jgi:hypothetical protein
MMPLIILMRYQGIKSIREIKKTPYKPIPSVAPSAGDKRRATPKTRAAKRKNNENNQGSQKV